MILRSWVIPMMWYRMIGLTNMCLCGNATESSSVQEWWFGHVEDIMVCSCEKALGCVWDVLRQSSKDPCSAGQDSVKGSGSGVLRQKVNTRYCSDTTLCMFVMQLSRLDIYNATLVCTAHVCSGSRIWEGIETFDEIFDVQKEWKDPF
jgi:hypothetical protein